MRADTGALGLPTAAHERGGPRWGLLGGAAALVLAVLLLVGRLTGGGPSTVTPSAGPGTGPSAPAVAAAPAPPPAAAALRLRVSGTPSWVSVLTSTGTSLFTGVLAAGAAREFSDPSRLQVVVGNAGAVTVGCAGQDVAAGTKGQVRRYTCAPTGLTPS
ncbi:MAG TPA: DUF4115 domain-containing protein [Mycobacteriales bacterium]|nr:DUF4115 domain-containing protein [Mycobacteriales bacterium]